MCNVKAAFFLTIFAGFIIIIHLILNPVVDLYEHLDDHSRDTQSTFISSDDILQINSIRNGWQRAFFEIFIIPNFMPSFSSHPSYADSIKELMQKHTDTPNLQDNIQRFNQLLHSTHSFFISPERQINLTEQKAFVVSYHRQIISIRRYIMILHQYLHSDADDNNSLKILDIFVKMRLTFVDAILNDAKYTKYWHLIHLSKSAGSSICQTSKDIKYADLDQRGNNCNIPFHSPPIKTADAGIFSCRQIESIRQREGVEFVASERPMTGHTVSNKPTHCNGFLYILPVRNPLKRIASTISEYNNIWYFPFQILTLYPNGHVGKGMMKGMDNPLKLRKRMKPLKCIRRLITIRNQTYGSLRTGDDYSDFLQRLFENEDEETEVDVMWYDNFRCQDESPLESEHEHLYRATDMTHIQWFGKDKKFAIKTTEGFKDRSNISLLRGYCSNTLTRWIGYQNVNGSNATYSLLFEKSSKINITHWINAVDFMIMTDYILPFDSRFDHRIWKFALQDLWNFKPKRKSKERRNWYGRISSKMSRRLTGRQEVTDKIARMKKLRAKRKRGKGKHVEIERRRRRFPKGRRWQRFRQQFPEWFGNYTINKTEWRHAHISYDGVEGEAKVSSRQFSRSWTNEDRKWIHQKNLLDMGLFKMAEYIADADANFYALVPAEND